MVSQERPLSPHLQVYRWQITMTMSILHRVTGVGLGLGALLMTYWFVAIASGPDDFADAQDLIGSWLGRLVLFGFTISLVFHFCNGIRHLFWDTGRGFDLPTMRASGWTVAVMTVLGSIAIWVAGYALRGGL
ncbi:MAG: succinate dehydrogenase, cytochrome b556 subunit [Alphaproteobacteria bacterium]|nr:succinate dehydrogenase, cytochrome b556 subunit [Alphaproteobacteria bacterium]